MYAVSSVVPCQRPQEPSARWVPSAHAAARSTAARADGPPNSASASAQQAVA